MKNFIAFFVLVFCLFLSAFTFKNSVSWNISSDFSIRFKSKNPEGKFSEFSGNIMFDEKDFAKSKFDVQIKTASINTGNGIKNKHAKSDKWFNAKKYPTIIFTSSSISKNESGFQVKGFMDMHGVKKEVSFPFTFKNNTFEGTFKMNRLDYKIGNTEGMNNNAATELQVIFKIPVTK